MLVIIRVMHMFTTSTRADSGEIPRALPLVRHIGCINDSETPHVDRKLSVLGITERELGRRHKPENEAWTPTF
jgi:hypothetical protein